MADEEALSAHSSSLTEEHLPEYTEDQLQNKIQELLRQKDVLDAESKMFEKFLKKIDPNFVPGIMLPAQSLFATAGGGHASLSDLSSRGPRKSRSKSKSSSSTMTMRLTVEQKCDIAQREIEELREETERARIDFDRVLDSFHATYEEAEQRSQETKKASYNLLKLQQPTKRSSQSPDTGRSHRDSSGDRLQRFPAERLIHFYEDLFKEKETTSEKLRLKISTLKQQYKKLQLQLKQKEEMGEVLHKVDFDQLKIENQQYLERIEERNQELLKLKVMAGRTQQSLNTHKKKLNSLQSENERVQSEISLRDEMIGRVEAERVAAEAEREKADIVNRKLKEQLSDFRVPDVMVYVREKADLDAVRAKNRIWKRKVDIAQMGLKTRRKAWHKLHSIAAANASSLSLPTLTGSAPNSAGWK